MPEVRMTVEEYLRLTGRAGQLQYIDDDTLSKKASKRMARKVSRAAKPVRKGKAPSGMSKALKTANKKAKLKSGKFRKGWDRSRMMKYAHKIRK